MALDRKAIGGLVASFTLLASIAGYEGYTSQAVIPVPGDVPTIGHGTTRYPNGQPVRMGDTATPAQADALLRYDVQRFGGEIKRCIHVPLAQREYDAFVSLSYNIGPTAFCHSGLVRKLNAGDYTGACREILKWDKFKGRPLAGLTRRRQGEYRMCVGEP